jgi:uncharacterized OB-fold protein
MSILTVILADTKEEAERYRPPVRSGFKRAESLEDYDLPMSTQCSKCGAEHIDQSRIYKQWRLSITDTK